MKKLSKQKMSLNKSTVANLNQLQMSEIKGGSLDNGTQVDSTHTYHTCEPWTCTCN